MIYDTIANLPRYKGIHPNLDTAIDFLTTHDLAALPNGRNEVDGDNAFVNVMDANYHVETDIFEAHHSYADIQICLTDNEQIGWLPAADFPEWEADKETKVFDERKAPAALLPLNQNVFVIMFPHDAHAPGIGEGTGHKLVGKVKIR